MNSAHSALLAAALVAALALLAFLPRRAAAADARIPERHTGLEPSFLGWIPVQRAASGEHLVLDMHRFAQVRPGDRIEVPPRGEGFSAAFDPQSFTLHLRLARDARGLLDIPVRLVRAGEPAPAPIEGALGVAVTPAHGHLFRFNAGRRAVKRVTVAGGFNGWSRDAHPMENTAPGHFELFAPMPSGEQEYKFIVDGEWITDPSNRRTANGNSVVTIPALDPGPAPRIYLESRSDAALVFRVATGAASAAKAVATLQRADGSSAPLPVTREGDTLRVDTSALPAGSWVRIIAEGPRGRPGNVVRAQVRPDGSFQWADGIMYYAFTDRFVNGNSANDRPVSHPNLQPQANYQGGDFEGVRRRIEEGYFDRLGVNIVWISPINRNPDGAWQEYLEPRRHYSGYHGYWPVSHDEVEPRFGGEPALRSMMSAARKAGIKVIADLVLKHVHADHPLWKEKPEWFGSLHLPDGTRNLRNWDAHQFTTWFEEWLPAFDFSKEEPVRFLLGNARDFVSRFGFDGYRLDAVKHIPYEFWWKFRAAMRTLEAEKGLPPMYHVGETFMDRRGILSFVGPNQLDGQFDFPLYDVLMEVFARHNAGFEALESALAESEAVYGKETLMSPLVGNHDKSRFMAFADGDLPDPEIPDEEELGWQKPPRVDDPARYERLKLALSFILAIDGVPMIYYGDEIGLTGAGDPDNRRMMPLEEQLDPAQRAVREHFSRAARARHAHPALRHGNRRLLLAEGPRYAFTRRHLDDAVLAAWNRSDTPAAFSLEVGPDLPDGDYRDALSDRILTVRAGRAAFTLPPMASAFFAAERAP